MEETQLLPGFTQFLLEREQLLLEREQFLLEREQIPPPAIPGPTPAPGTPTDFKVMLNPDGSLELTWKCPNPGRAQGTIYQIARRTGPTGAFNMIGGSGLRKFTDGTVPAGVSSVTYQVQAVRSTVIGTAGQFTVNFGTAGDGSTTAAVVESAPKLAA